MVIIRDLYTNIFLLYITVKELLYYTKMLEFNVLVEVMSVVDKCLETRVSSKHLQIYLPAKHYMDAMNASKNSLELQ